MRHHRPLFSHAVQKYPYLVLAVRIVERRNPSFPSFFGHLPLGISHSPINTVKRHKILERCFWVQARNGANRIANEGIPFSFLLLFSSSYERVYGKEECFYQSFDRAANDLIIWPHGKTP